MFPFANENGDINNCEMRNVSGGAPAFDVRYKKKTVVNRKSVLNVNDSLNEKFYLLNSNTSKCAVK